MVSGESISIITQPDPDRETINDFAYACHRFARIYLKKKIKSRQLYLNQFDMDVSDLAWDCIAELFVRDENGGFPELRTYYGGLDLDEMTDKQLTAHTRRLVFSKVNDGLFRLHNTYDSSLGKIIRNLKNAVQLDEEVRLDREKNDQVLDFRNPAKSEEESRLVLMPSDLLEARLVAEINDKMFMREVLERVKHILRREIWYKTEYPLVELAQVIRNAFSRSAEVDNKEYQGNGQPLFRKEELTHFIDETIEELKNKMYPRYVKTDKLDAQTFYNYFRSIRDIMMNAFVMDRGNLSYYDFLKEYMVEVSKDTYRQHHRIYIEYLVKLVRSNLVNRIRRENKV